MVRFDRFRIDYRPEQTALLVVDMVDTFVAPSGDMETPAAREMIPQLQRVLDASRAADVQVIYLKPNNRSSGVDAGSFLRITPEIADGIYADTSICDELAPEDGDIVVEKHRYDGFFGTELDSILHTLDISTVAITGTQTHICCDSTMRSAFFNGYDILAIEDCVATMDLPDQGWGDVHEEEIERVWFTTVATNFGDVVDSDTYIEELEEVR